LRITPRGEWAEGGTAIPGQPVGKSSLTAHMIRVHYLTTLRWELPWLGNITSEKAPHIGNVIQPFLMTEILLQTLRICNKADIKDADWWEDCNIDLNVELCCIPVGCRRNTVINLTTWKHGSAIYRQLVIPPTTRSKLRLSRIKYRTY